MENRIASLVVDAVDAEALGRFWADVLGRQVLADPESNESCLCRPG
jgi:hypothetical protein